MNAALRFLYQNEGRGAVGWDLRSLWLMMTFWQRAVVVAVIVIFILLLLRLLRGAR